MTAGIHVGTSGWIYPHWRGRFYPAALSSARWLEFLAARVSSVEVNGTFYSLTTPRACDRWRAAVPPEFVFAVKGSRYITHMKQLRDPRIPLANFFASGILRLGAQLGPILWQLPPALRFRPEVAEDFFAALPGDVRAAERLARRHDGRVTGRACLTAPDGRDREILYAIEPRHASWMGEEAANRLREHGMALVRADTAGRHPAAGAETTRRLAYVRLHGARRIYEGRYTEEELKAWRERARAWARAETPSFIYFDNDREGAAAADASALESLIRRPLEAPPEFSAATDLPSAPRENPPHFAFRSGGG